MLWGLLVAWNTGNLLWLQVHAAFTIFAALKIGNYDPKKGRITVFLENLGTKIEFSRLQKRNSKFWPEGF